MRRQSRTINDDDGCCCFPAGAGEAVAFALGLVPSLFVMGLFPAAWLLCGPLSLVVSFFGMGEAPYFSAGIVVGLLYGTVLGQTLDGVSSALPALGVTALGIMVVAQASLRPLTKEFYRNSFVANGQIRTTEHGKRGAFVNLIYSCCGESLAKGLMFLLSLILSVFLVALWGIAFFLLLSGCVAFVATNRSGTPSADPTLFLVYVGLSAILSVTVCRYRLLKQE